MAELDADMAGVKRVGSSMESLRRKKFKLSELPISTAQRTAIDNLLYSFKKKGGFDAVRKEVWAKFNDSDAKNSFTASLIEMAESEIERDPSLLSRERGKAATLISGAVDRSDLHSGIEEAVDAIISNHIDDILASLRKIRAQDVGEDAANAEIAKGLTTDAEYEKLVQAKREEREKIRQKELEVERKAQEEKKKAEAEEKQRQRELRKKREEEDRKRREEREEKRRLEREKQREEDRLREERRERERDERYERRRREEKERYRERDRERERDYDRDKSRRSDLDRGRDGSGTPRDTSRLHKPSAPPVDEKALEDAALELLLKEGKELAAKSRQKPEFDFEQAEALENGQALQPATTTRSVPSKSKADPSLSSQEPARPKTEDRESRRSRSRRRDRRETRKDVPATLTYTDQERETGETGTTVPSVLGLDVVAEAGAEAEEKTIGINTGLMIETGKEIEKESVIETGIGTGIERGSEKEKESVTVTVNVRAEVSIAAIALVPVQGLALEHRHIGRYGGPNPRPAHDHDQQFTGDTGRGKGHAPQAVELGLRQEMQGEILIVMFLQLQREAGRQNGERGHQTEIETEIGCGTETETEIETVIVTEIGIGIGVEIGIGIGRETGFQILTDMFLEPLERNPGEQVLIGMTGEADIEMGAVKHYYGLTKIHHNKLY
ncbi:arginine rich protein [Microsporum canis CBS 113480]|uniref:Arginine rich protein n=1 Tax=Arthroderma otae (strain ATCC MYA-4605 / CBS 113480) TaxID=554155 RepID=C5FJR8_ARTOC|nr:arginine rich protein [Microsporum canis CBS 113480]EEQ30929.1 arginine rich protein [Microsporum canis CBS 113480]